MACDLASALASAILKKQNTNSSDKHIQLTHFYKLDISYENVCWVAYETSSKLNMFITTVCVLFLIKLRWPKKKSLYDLAILPGENTHKSLN